MTVTKGSHSVLSGDSTRVWTRNLCVTTVHNHYTKSNRLCVCVSVCLRARESRESFIAARLRVNRSKH